MEWDLFPRGVLIGLSVAAPVGPMSVLCIRRTLSAGRLAGFISGLGVAAADAMYGAVAAFGLSSITELLVEGQSLVRLVGGGFLCYLGWRTFSSTAADPSAEANGPVGSAAAFASTFGLTLTNPMTILSFAAIFAGVGVTDRDRGSVEAAALVLGVFLGSTLWWLVLSSGANLLRGRLTSSRLTWINRVSGVVIFVFGLIALASIAR